MGGMGHGAMPMNMNMMGGHGGHGGMPGLRLMNLAEVDEKKADAPKVEELNKKKTEKKESHPAKKASKPAKKNVTDSHPGTKKVMEEISFEKPTWEDKKGYGWANLPLGAAYEEMPFAGPYGDFSFGFEEPLPFAGAYDFGYPGFEGPLDLPVSPYGLGFETPFAGAEFGYPLGAAAPFAEEPFLGVPGYGADPYFAEPEFGFGLGAAAFPYREEFAAPFAGPEFMGGYDGFYEEGPLGVWNGFDAAPFLAVPNYSWKK